MIGKLIVNIFLGIILLLTSIWGSLALLYTLEYSETIRYGFVTLFILISLLSLLGVFSKKWRYKAVVLYAFSFTSLLFYYGTLKPSNEREWKQNVAKLSYATQKDNLISIYNIRNFEYRSEIDYTPAYYDKTYDIDKLEGVDLVSVYWMGPSVAHIFLSFHFGGDEYLAVSIETRTEKGEGYSTLKGFFRQYELYYVVADEKDVIKLRTNYRKNPVENLYIYPLLGSKQSAQKLFLEYMQRINTLKSEPEFYNTLSTNCTTAIWNNAHVTDNRIPFSWKVLLSGYVPEYLYESGYLDTEGLSFKALQKRVHANARANRVKDEESFSLKIRE